MTDENKNYRNGRTANEPKGINQPLGWEGIFSSLETDPPSLNIVEYPPDHDPAPKVTQKETEVESQGSIPFNFGPDVGHTPTNGGKSEMFDSLSVFEEAQEVPLIDLFPNSSETATVCLQVKIGV